GLGSALLGSRQLGLVFGHDDVHRSAGLLDCRHRGLRRASHLEAHFRRKLALSEQTHAILAAPRYPRSLQGGVVDHGLGVELAGIDQLLHLAQVDLGIVLAERIVEPALRQTHVQRHLAAPAGLDRHARTALLALLAASAGRAFARANATADANALLARARIVTDIVEFHINALALAFVAREFRRSLRPCEAAWRS